MSKLLLITAFITAFGSFAHASECKYIDRAGAGFFLSKMPSEVVGILNCQLPDVNELLVVKLPTITRESVRAAAQTLARLQDHTSTEATVTWESKENPIQVIVRSVGPQNSNGEVIATIHYAFAANDRVFFHPIDESAMPKAKPSLERIKHIVSQMKIDK